MVDILKPTYAPAAGGDARYLKRVATQQVESHSDEKEPPSPRFYVDRRKGGDRRVSAGSARRNYEMRHSAGRRRQDRTQPKIETKA